MEFLTGTPVKMRVIMPAMIHQAGRQFNVDETDMLTRRTE
jgi:hypothetical protein